MIPLTRELETRFRRNLKAKMAAAGLSQSELARRMAVSPSYINQLASGHRRPALDTLGAVAKALGCDASDLIANGTTAKA